MTWTERGIIGTETISEKSVLFILYQSSNVHVCKNLPQESTGVNI